MQVIDAQLILGHVLHMTRTTASEVLLPLPKIHQFDVIYSCRSAVKNSNVTAVTLVDIYTHTLMNVPEVTRGGEKKTIVEEL